MLGLFGPNWTTKTEYLYVDLGSRPDTFIVGSVHDRNNSTRCRSTSSAPASTITSTRRSSRTTERRSRDANQKPRGHAPGVFGTLPGKKIIGVLIVVAIGQIIGWGTVGLLAVVGREVAADLGMDITAVFAGNSIFYVATGLTAPLLARPFIRFGARRVMIAGSIIAAPGFVLLSVATGPVSFFAAWVILGIAGSATLATATYILLNEIVGSAARRAIGALMVVTGLASSVFWPTTSYLAGVMGWRGTCLVYAGLMIFICLPLNVFGLPRRAESEEVGGSSGSTDGTRMVRKSTFYLIVMATILCAFVTFGFNATMIELLKTEGLTAAQAVTFGSMLGVFQVSARGLDFLGGGRWTASRRR